MELAAPEVDEAPLPEVDILPLEAPQEGMVDAGDGVFVCPTTAGPGITFWPLWKPDPVSVRQGLCGCSWRQGGPMA